MNMRQAYIAVEGVIGVGKTTLARMFQKETGGHLLLEVFEENPFLSDFYTDRARYAFQTQIFFLLSRYHQQRQITRLPRPLISDYMFDKDRLFAQVNLDGDELETYFSVHEALAENITRPDLVVFLKADTATLMNRITARDRPYERNMEAAYIDRLRAAYEQFFSAYEAAPVLIVDTNDIDFVQNAEDRDVIFSRIRGALGQGPRQTTLPGMNHEALVVTPAAPVRSAVVEPAAPSLSEFQRFHRLLDDDQGLPTDPYLNFMLLQEEIGRLAQALTQRWIAANAGQPDHSPAALRDQLAGVLAYVMRLANATGIDLEEVYLEKVRENQQPDSEGETL